MPSRAEIIVELTAGGPFELKLDQSAGYPQRLYQHAPASLREVLIASAAHGDRPFLIWGEEVVSFAEHATRVSALARFLLARGVAKGDRVAVGMRNYPEWLLIYWACVASGIAAVGMNAWWVAEEMAYAIEDSEPKVLFGDAERLERAGAPEGVIRVAVRAPVTDGVKLTVTEQLWPAATVLPEQPSGLVAKSAAAAPETVTEVTGSGEPPAFVRFGRLI